nr:alpha-galactosidase [Granulosicoccus sp.]
MSTSPNLWRLDGKTTTLLVLDDHACPRIFWYGKRLSGEFDESALLALDDAALAFGSLDSVTPLSLFPQASSAYPGSPALNGHRNGHSFAHAFRTHQIHQNDQTLNIELRDPHAQLRVMLSLRLDPDSDIASVETTLTNEGSEAYTVDWLASASLPLPGSYLECLSQHGRWGLENQSFRRRIAPGRIDISNLRGRTSHEHVPSLVCGTAGFDVDQGDVTFVHLAWSGNFSLRIERLSDGNGAIQPGVQYLPGEKRLEAHESMTTPTAMFTRGQGMNQCTQRFHQYIRSSVLPAWTRKPRPVHANSWEALYFNHDQQALFSLVEAAASIGAERFVLDDGWFRHRRSDNAGLGDWFVDEEVYPKGLHPVVEHIRSHGMEFGLWFEPEMVNPDSDLYRAHPDWVLHVKHIETPLARNQLVLDIARDDVADYLFERISSLVDEYQIDYIKWDQNRDLVLAGDGDIARAAKQPVALYALLDRI